MTTFKFEVELEIEAPDVVEAEESLEEFLNENCDVVVSWKYLRGLGG
jgi:hypothetical protein